MDPVFDAEQLAQQLGALPGAGSDEPRENDTPADRDVLRVLRTIADNDIRARIIGLPAEMRDALPEDAATLNVASPPCCR